MLSVQYLVTASLLHQVHCSNADMHDHDTALIVLARHVVVEA